MERLEIELSDELSERLNKVATKVALSPSETARMILAHELASERSIDWLDLINKGRELLRRLIKP